MADLWLQVGLSNACFSLALAIVAMVVGAKAKRPQLAYMLWLFVFIKLITPPIVTIPVGQFFVQTDPGVNTHGISPTGTRLPIVREFEGKKQPVRTEKTPASLLVAKMGTNVNHAKPWLTSIWLLGSALVFGGSLLRILRFNWLLGVSSACAPAELQTEAEDLARRLSLNTVPTICTTSARLSPMVWWTGGKVRLIFPTAILDQMETQQWSWILAHELAHVRRRDYLVRWLEWLACVVFWWNPVVWWAQRNLRAFEEICCDDLVIACLNPKPKSYANSLLSAVEFLARPVLRPPAMASEINSGRALERRFKMIISDKPNRSNSRWLTKCIVLLCAMVVGSIPA